MQAITLSKTVNWFNKTEGRDKLSKVIQYGSRLLMWHFLQQNKKETSDSFKNLFTHTRDARKLFRLAKTLNEIQKIIEILNSGPINVPKALQLLQRLWFGLYWIFDNLQVLSSIKFLNKEAKPLGKTAATFWLLALLTGLIDIIRNLTVNFMKIAQLKSQMVNGQKFDQNKQSIVAQLNENTKLYVALVRTLGDLIPAGMASEVIPKLFNVTLHDGWIGFGGLVSASIAAWQAY